MPRFVRAEKFALNVVRQLRRAGFQALWAGGCVRDRLMGRLPEDYDVATDATPRQVQEVFRDRKTLAIGAAFGVIAVIGPRDSGTVEVATFREDGGYSDGRHPDSVRYASAEADALRRDFTINGLFYDPLESRVIDYVGGQEDLKNRIVRAIGDPVRRIQEDRLRMLRGIRFAANFQFDLEPATRQAISDFSSTITRVSRERIHAELRKMYADVSRERATALLHGTGLLQSVLDSSLLNLDRISGSIKLLGHLQTREFTTGFAALLFPLLDEITPTVLRNLAKKFNEWKLSNVESHQIRYLLESLPVVLSGCGSNWPAVQRILIQPGADQLLQIAKAMKKCHPGKYDSNVAYCLEQLELPPDVLNPPPLIGGTDLIKAGFRAGPGFREVLERIRDQQLLGQLKSAEEAIGFARKYLSAPGSGDSA